MQSALPGNFVEADQRYSMAAVPLVPIVGRLVRSQPVD